jgi:hypothetical protein
MYSLRICWSAPCERRNLSSVFKMVLHWCSLWQLRELSPHFCLCCLWRHSPNAHTLTTKVSPRVKRESDSKFCILTIALFLKVVLRISCMSDAVFESLKQNLMQCIVPSNRALEYSGLCFTPTTLNTHWEAVQRVMALKLTRQIQKTAVLWHIVAGSCTTWHFWS